MTFDPSLDAYLPSCNTAACATPWRKSLNHPSRNTRPFSHRIRYLLLLGIGAKLLVDTAVQLYNPFLSIIAVGAGVSIASMGRLVSLRHLMGLTAPILGSVADRFGYRWVIQGSLLLSGIGMLVIAASKNVFALAVGMILTGIGQAGYTPNIHAYISSKLPYAKRAMGLGMIEYSWALAGIIGLFLAGRLIDTYSWRTPFILLGFAFIAMTFWFFTVPRDRTLEQRDRADSKSGVDENESDKLENTQQVTRESTVRVIRPGGDSVAARVMRTFMATLDIGSGGASAWASVVVAGLCMFSIMHILIIHGGWLQAEYALSASALGTVALVFGVTDLVSSVLVSVAVDRIGKRRSVLIGVVGAAIGFFLLPFLNRGVIPAIISIALPRMFFEFSIVSLFPLLSEQSPEHRGKVLSLGITAGLLGSTLAGITGPKAYLSIGVFGLGPVSCIASLIALLLLVFFVREGGSDSPAKNIANSSSER